MSKILAWFRGNRTATFLGLGAAVVILAGVLVGVLVSRGGHAPTAAARSSGSIDATGDIKACPDPATATAPVGSAFSGGTFDGHGAKLSNTAATYTVGSNTCVENFDFSAGSLRIDSGASNVIIVNNKFSGWPAKDSNQAISGVLTGGRNITINYNSFYPRSGPGEAYTVLYGIGGVTDLTIDHNWFGGNDSIDSVQQRCSDTCYNIYIRYNRFYDQQSFAVETQQVVHGLYFQHNYANWTTQGSAADHGGAPTASQYSISNSSEIDVTGTYYKDSATDVDVSGNIAVQSSATSTPSCFEIRGTGANLHDNYCYNYETLCDYANTNSPYHSGPWYAQHNTVVGQQPAGCWVEGDNVHYDQPGYPNIAPSNEGTNTYSSVSADHPAMPEWNYANGVQW